MHRILMAAAFAAAATGITSAEAAGRHKHPTAYAHPAYAHVVRTPQVGPIWAGPNQCWTDEGYGRYASCNGRR